MAVPSVISSSRHGAAMLLDQLLGHGVDEVGIVNCTADRFTATQPA